MSGFNKYIRGALTVLFLITCIALLSYLKPPAWIFASGIGRTTHPERVINVSRTELEQFPPLVEAIYLADTAIGAHPTEYANCSNRDGMKITNHFGGQYWAQDNTYRLLLNVDGQLYQISIYFAHKPRPIA